MAFATGLGTSGRRHAGARTCASTLLSISSRHSASLLPIGICYSERVRGLTVASIVLVSWGCSPQPGDDCADPESIILLSDSCGTMPGSAQCVLQCTRGPGCDGDGFYWVYGDGYPTYYWCGCDGVTHESNIDFGGPPNTRWQWFGSCEDPCFDVGRDNGQWVWGPDYHRAAPVAPQCEQCRDAYPVDFACLGADGLSRPRVCCDCTHAMRDAGGACVDTELRIEISSTCCP